MHAAQTPLNGDILDFLSDEGTEIGE